MKKQLFFILVTAITGWMLTRCQKDVVVENPVIKEATDANKFVYNGLSTYYLWVDNVPALTNTKYENHDSLNVFLNKYSKPDELFYSLLYQYKTIDKWSFIVDNAATIDNWISGISESQGMDFMLYYLDNTQTNLIGVIRYVLKDSPAAKAGLKRGDLFLEVNGQQLTASNYQNLMLTQKTYTLGLASYNGSTFISNGKSVTMTAVLLQENPIHLDTVLNISNIKVGYLVYNGFTASYDSLIHSSFDIELNKVFGKFKTAGIQKLIIDLRYNGGGVVQTASYLASMIYSTDNSRIFSKMQLNSTLQNYYTTTYGADYLNDYFTNTIAKTDKMPATAINSLGLNQVYIITSSETASASELLINGLKPYISVIQVGTNTTGKYTGSFTVKDYIDNKGTVNPNHTWVMQPITFKNSNSLGVSDYVNGLVPDISVREYPSELYPFCDPNEPLLKACLDNIRGTKSATIRRGPDLKGFKSSNDFNPMGKNMVREGLFRPDLLRK